MTYIVDMKDLIGLIFFGVLLVGFLILWAIALIGEAVRKWQQKKIDEAYKEEKDDRER